MAEISQLRIKLRNDDTNSSDDECLDTIRRMREMMENSQLQDDDQSYSKRMKENMRDNATPSMESLGCHSSIEKQGWHERI